MGFEGILLEGWDPVLLGQKQHHVMQPVTTGLHAEDFRIAREKAIGPVREDFGLLLKDYKLSDDIAFRFGNQAWSEFPLQTDKYVNWLKQIVGESINLFMDYETFGEHQWEATGIFKFMEDLPEKVLAAGISFLTPSEALKTFPRRGEINCHQHLSWADQERDLSAWTGNQLQDSCLESIAGMEKKLHPFKNSRKKNWREVVELWRKMQTSDHFYYMCLKYWQDGDVHKYFSPYQSPYEAYIAYMNVFARLKEKVELLLQNEK
jgi:alpha-amylase